MTTLKRSVRFRTGSTTFNLNDQTTYRVVVDGWSSNGDQLLVRLHLQDTTMTRLEAAASAVQRWIGQARRYAEDMAGDPVWIEYKTCDEVSATADLGATWRRKLVRDGVASLRWMGTADRPVAFLDVTLTVDEEWQRSTPEPVLVGSSSVTVRSDGGITSNAAAVTARRVAWTRSTGFTGRVHWLYTAANCNFFLFNSQCYAVWYESAKRFYIFDNAGNSAASSQYSSWTAGATVVDVQFRWDPTTPGMAIFVNGVKDGVSPSCTFNVGVSGSELMTNAGFETVTGTADDGANDTWTGWTKENNSTSYIEATATVNSGARALKLKNNSTAGGVYQTVTVTASTTYKWTFYTRGSGSIAGLYSVYDATHSAWIVANTSTGVTGTTYTLKIVQFTTPAGCTSIRVYHYSNGSGGYVYFDDNSLTEVTSTDVQTVTVFSPTGSQSILQAQIWPAVLTDTECIDLYYYGRPDAELCFAIPPANDFNTNAAYRLYNAPGDAPAPVRAVVSSTGSQDYSQVRLGLRPLRIQTATLWECESGTLGAATASTADGTASGGNVARFTPADTSYATRVTVVIAANPVNVRPYIGDYRLYLAGKDNAASIDNNLIRWRLVVAGQSEDYSDEYSFAAVSTYSLLDLGTVSIPPGTWPEESDTASSTDYGASYLTIEIQVKNVAGAGGGTLDLDALYLAPAEYEATCVATLDVSDQFLVLDAASVRESAVTVHNYRTMEFGGWGTYTGDLLFLTPVMGDAGLLWLCVYRTTAEQSYAFDLVSVWLYIAPRWRQ